MYDLFRFDLAVINNKFFLTNIVFIPYQRCFKLSRIIKGMAFKISSEEKQDKSSDDCFIIIQAKYFLRFLYLTKRKVIIRQYFFMITIHGTSRVNRGNCFCLKVECFV